MAPLLLLLVFAIISYGYMLSFRQAISQSAAEGARAAAVAPAALTDIEVATKAREAVNEGLGSYGVTCTTAGRLALGSVDAGTCTISAPLTCSASTTGARCVKVTLDYAYRDHSLLPAVPGLGAAMPSHLTFITEAQVS